MIEERLLKELLLWCYEYGKNDGSLVKVTEIIDKVIKKYKLVEK